MGIKIINVLCTSQLPDYPDYPRRLICQTMLSIALLLKHQKELSSEKMQLIPSVKYQRFRVVQNHYQCRFKLFQQNIFGSSSYLDISFCFSFHLSPVCTCKEKIIKQSSQARSIPPCTTWGFLCPFFFFTVCQNNSIISQQLNRWAQNSR